MHPPPHSNRCTLKDIPLERAVSILMVRAFITRPFVKSPVVHLHVQRIRIVIALRNSSAMTKHTALVAQNHVVVAYLCYHALIHRIGAPIVKGELLTSTSLAPAL